MSMDDGYNLAAYLRVASIAVALYDYLQSFPSVCRVYREQWRTRRFTLSLFLLALIRATSIAAIALSNFGFFYGHFSDALCARYYILPPVFKVLQTLVSQAILGTRAYNVSQRCRVTGIFIVIIYIVCSVLEGVTTISGRRHYLDPHYGNCRPIFSHKTLSAWTNYTVVIAYDLSVTLITVSFILRYRRTSSNGSLTKLSRMMLCDGLGYFLVLTVVNIVNAVFYHLYDKQVDVQTAAASLAYCLTWIMSQKLLIHLHNASMRHRNDTISTLTITQPISTPRDVSRAMRSQFESKSGFGNGFELTVPDFDMDSVESGRHSPDFSVQVRVEKTVRMERRPRYELENYSRRYTTNRDVEDGQWP